METISLLKDISVLPAPPQELPVDLTIKNILPPQDLLNHLVPKMSTDVYPHLRFHKSVIEETNKLRENTLQTKLIKSNREDCSILPVERKSSSLLPKKRQLEDDSDYYTSVKKFRYEHFQPLVPPTPISQQHYIQKTKLFLPNVHSGGEYFDPSQAFEHASLLNRMQNHPISGSPESIKETEALMAAVQHSQMLYYSYCTQLLQSLQAQRVLNEQEHRVKLSRSNHATRESRVKPEKSSERTRDNQSKVESKQEVSKNERLSPTSSIPTALKTSSTPSSSPNSSVEYSQSPSSGNEGEDKVTSSAERKLSSGRKRVPRALTGKHVRPGTGASLTTLMSLRQKLNQRQKLRQEENNSDKNVENFVSQDRSPCWRRS